MLGPFCLDIGGDHEDSVFLAGSGRSGTTWVSDVINYRGEYRYVFEPFDPSRVRLCEGFGSKQYLRPGDRREEFLDPARTILSGGLRSFWTDRGGRRFVARRRLIKDIRANLLLRWMSANFPGMPIVLLLRHPCAVVDSRLRLGWRDNLAETMEQDQLVEDFLWPFEGKIRGARTDFERHVFLWCIDNYVPLKQFARGGIHLAYYENLVAHPEDEVRRLFSFLGKEFDKRVCRGMERPSSLSRGGGTVAAGRVLGGWRESLGGPRVRRAVEILALFGLDGVYGERAMPDPGAAYALMDPAEESRGGGHGP